ncbi:hypothetical protein ACFLVX_00110 [Chloroflexota bacterium]
MRKPFQVWKDVYAIGGPELSHSSDCCVYLINAGDLVLIDSGVRSRAILKDTLVSYRRWPEVKR